MSRCGELLFGATASHYGGDMKTVDVLRRLDERGSRFERIGRLTWSSFPSPTWRLERLVRDGTWEKDARIEGVCCRSI